MAVNISARAAQIRTAVHGLDVRDNLAGGLEDIAGDLNSYEATLSADNDDFKSDIGIRQTNLENTFNQEIANQTVANPSNAETVAARTDNINSKTYDTIGKRLDDHSSQLADNTNLILQNKQQIMQTSNFMQISNNSTKPAEYARADKKIFDLRSNNEWDYILNATFLNGGVRPTTSNSNMQLARALNKTANNLTIQAKIWYDGTQNIECIGYNNTGFGQYQANTGRIEIGYVDSAGGICLNVSGTFTLLLAKAKLVPNNWYIVTLFNMNGAGFASVVKDGETLAAIAIISTTLPPASSVQATCYSSNDTITNIRYTALQNNNVGRLQTPNILYAANLDTPIRMIYGTNNVQTVAYIPAGYNPYIKNKVVIFFHGDGGHADDIVVWANENSMIQPLLDNGYVIISSEYANNRSWGNQQVTQDIQDLMTHWKYHLNIEDSVYVMAESMGGITALNSIYHDKLNVKAFAGMFPVSNLTESFTHSSFKPEIETAYGITNDSDFASKTSGYDPLRDFDFNKFKYIPFLLWHSYSDTMVPRAQHSDILKQKLDAVGASCILNTSTGEHGDASNFVPTDVVNFFNNY